MNTLAVISGAVTALSPIILAVFTWLVNRRINRRAADDKALGERLLAQREDFKAVMDPLQSQVTQLATSNSELTGKVAVLEKRVDRAEDDQRYLVYDFRRTRHYYLERYRDGGPTLTSRTRTILERSHDD